MSDEQAGQPSAVPAAAPATPEPVPQPAASQAPEADKTTASLVASIMDGTAVEESPPAPPPASPPAPVAPPAPDLAPQAQDQDGLDLDDPELTEDDLRQAERAKHAFASLKGKLKKARDDGQFGNLIRRMGEAAELNPDMLANWVDIGARLNRDDPSALQDMARLLGAQRLKIVPMDQPAAPAPATPPASPAPPADRVKALAGKLYDEEFKASVDDFSMSEEVARAKATAIAERLLRAQAAAAPSPALSQPVSEPPPPPQPQAAKTPGQSYLEQAAYDEVGRYAQAYAAKIPDFVSVVLPEVSKRILAQHQAAGGTSPLQWVSEFNDMVRRVQAERSKPAAAPVVTSGLRPSTQTKGASKSYEDVRENIVASIMGGGLPD